MRQGMAPCAAGMVGLAACLALIVTACSTVGEGPQSADASPVGTDDRGNAVHEPPDDYLYVGGGDSIDSGESGGDGSELSEPFLRAVPVALSSPSIDIEGSISTPGDVDVYDVGPVYAGEELIVDVQGAPALDAMAAVFDADENLVYANDDRAFYAQLVDPKITVRMRRDTAHTYVAIASSFAGGTTGTYVAHVSVQPGTVEGEPPTQWVYFNFDGAQVVRIGTRSPVDVPPFEGSLVAPVFAGRTDELIERVMALVREDYTGLNVELVCSREPRVPPGAYTTIHFGAYDPDLLGVAENIDEYNAQVSQQAIVFVDTFKAFMPMGPSVDEMAQAIANVASHETGHLLGLQHTNDPKGVMDVTANMRQMMGPQCFRRSPLDPYVFPIGQQDAPQLLVEAVGGDLSVLKATAAAQLTARALWYDVGAGPPARDSHPFSTCFCQTCTKKHMAQHQHDPSR